MNTEAVSYAQALSDAWYAFCAKHELTIYYESENKGLIGKAFMAGWITGIGSINGNR